MFIYLSQHNVYQHGNVANILTAKAKDFFKLSCLSIFNFFFCILMVFNVHCPHHLVNFNHHNYHYDTKVFSVLIVLIKCKHYIYYCIQHSHEYLELSPFPKGFYMLETLHFLGSHNF